jgi:hypothetical protein
MLKMSRQEASIDQLAGRLRKAGAVAHGTITDVISHACTRLAAKAPYARERLDRLIAAGAWLDAVLALLALEAPQWKLRRLALDDGEWFCSLSRQPQIPIELDDAIESHHENAAVAILLALVEARKVAAPISSKCPAVSQRQPRSADAVNCDNFA